MSNLFDIKKENIIMRVYQPSIPVDESKPPRMISGVVDSVPNRINIKRKSKSQSPLKPKGSDDAG